jgi:hypothetical protein
VRTRKSEARTRMPHGGMAKHRLDAASLTKTEPDELEDTELLAQDGDSVPQPLEDWSDNDDTNRWLDEHRFGEDDQFNIN